jgi:hypothetical protein
MQALSVKPRWKTRLARALGLDGNPLRRASDRAEAWIRAGLLVIFLIAGPIAAIAAGQWTAHAASAGTSGTSGQPHAARAVLLQQAITPAHPAPAVRHVQVWVRARWESAGGSARTGEVPAPAGAPAGTVVTIWLNASGRVTGPPQPGVAASAAVMTAVMTLAIMAFALLATLRLLQRFLNWRRLAAWEAAWRATGPRWTDHRS